QKGEEDAAIETPGTVKKQQQQQQQQKKKKKQALSKKARGKQRADRDASHGAARLAAAPELRRSARLRAHATQGYATAQEADDLVQEPVSGSEDKEGHSWMNWLDKE
ncbi:MAG: hypothetical protein Q9204_008231, partial [Flavoplaca sp. TL-2023a]